MRTSFAHSLINLYPCPSQRLNDIFFSPADIPRLVSVFNAQYEYAVILPGKKIVIESGPDTSYMERSCGAGSKTYTYFSVCHLSM
jgi:hypothetical protein